MVDPKKNRTDGLLDAYDLAFLESGAPSPAMSEQSNTSGHIKLSDVGNRGDDSSNDELMADCDSTSGSHTPGKRQSFISFILVKNLVRL